MIWNVLLIRLLNSIISFWWSLSLLTKVAMNEYKQNYVKVQDIQKKIK